MLFVQALSSYSLAGAGATAGDTTLLLKSFTTIDGAVMTMAMFGDIGYATIEPGNAAYEEQMSFTGITQNANGTALLTGVKTVLFISPYTETSGLAKTHAGSTAFVVSNTSGFYNKIRTQFGDLSGPSSSTDNAIARYDGTTGKLVQNSAINISDLTAGTTYIMSTDAVSGAGKDIAIYGCNSTDDVGGSLQFKAGDATAGNKRGGYANNLGGAGFGSGAGGSTQNIGGQGGATGAGGAFVGQGGAGGATSGNGGAGYFYGGNATNGNGGNLFIKAGALGGGGAMGRVYFTDPTSGFSALVDMDLIASSDKVFKFPNRTSTIFGFNVVTTTDDSTAVIDIEATDTYELSAVANATTFSTTGTPRDGQRLIIRFKDAGVAKGLTWDAVFVAIGVTLPTTTVTGKWHYVGCQYNAGATKWHALAVGVQA